MSWCGLCYDDVDFGVELFCHEFRQDLADFPGGGFIGCHAMEVSQLGILCEQHQWFPGFQSQTKTPVVFREESQCECGFPIGSDVRATGQFCRVVRTTDQVPEQRVCFREWGLEVGDVEFENRGLHRKRQSLQAKQQAHGRFGLHFQ